jgi:hypothetical protein
MRIGDVSRQRRFADPARQRWYAYHRALRFALRMLRGDLKIVPLEAQGQKAEGRGQKAD